MYEQTKGHHIKRYILQYLGLVVNDNQKQKGSMSSHIAGRKKKLADLLSCNKIFPPKWTLNDQVVQAYF